MSASEFPTPHFDEVTIVEIAGSGMDLVFHRDTRGEILGFHSPLTGGAISCTICDSGAHIYLTSEGH